MAKKSKRPAAVATAGGANGIVVSKNTIAKTGAAANSPVITSIRRRPYGKVAWLVSIKGICVDAPIRDRKLLRYRRVRAAIKYRFGVDLDPMPESAWSAIVEAAIAEGDAS